MDAIAGAAFGMQVDTLDNPEEPFNVQGLRLMTQSWVIHVLSRFLVCRLPVFCQNLTINVSDSSDRLIHVHNYCLLVLVVC